MTTVAPTLCGKQKASKPFLQVLTLRGWQWTALLFVMTLVSPHPAGRRRPFNPSLHTKYSRLEVVVDGVVSAARLTPGRKALPAPKKSVDGPGSGFTSNSFSITLFLPPAAFFGGFLPGCKTTSTFPLLLIQVEWRWGGGGGWGVGGDLTGGSVKNKIKWKHILELSENASPPPPPFLS